MTKKELLQLWYLNREIDREQKRLFQLKAAATDTSVKVSGLPHGNHVSDKTAVAALIADSEAVLQEKIQLCIAEYNRLNRFIASVDDSLTRQILQLRYVDGLSWVAVAHHSGCGSESTVRSIVDRFLDHQ